MISLSLVFMLHVARAAELSPWTGRESPKIFADFTYPYQVALELEINTRTFALIVGDLDITELERFRPLDLKTVSDGYMNLETLADLWRDDPALARRLTEGLALEEDAVRQQLRSNVAAVEAERLGRFRKSLPPALQQATATWANRLGEVERLAFIGIERPRVNTTPGRPMGTPVTSDWPIVNARWNSLGWERQRAHVRFDKLSADRRAQVVQKILPHHTNPFDVTSDGADYLRPFDVGTDGLGIVEVLHRRPVGSAVEYLRQFETLARKTNTFHRLKDQMSATRLDASYHLNFSVDDRPESLEPVLVAWRNLIVIQQLQAGLVNVFRARAGSNYALVQGRGGSVRLKESNFVEISDHFTDPETELAMLMTAIDLPNRDAVKLIYERYMPPITPAMIKFVYAVDRLAFLGIFFASPGLSCELPPGLVSMEQAMDLGSMIARRSRVAPAVLHDPGRLARVLGPEAFAALVEEVITWTYHDRTDGGPPTADRMRFLEAVVNDRLVAECAALLSV